MVKLIHRDFGTTMYVSEDRLEEYLSAGHKPAEAPKEAKEPAAVKKKATKKK